MLDRHSSPIALAFTAMLAAASPTFADENAKTPCETVARHLRDVAERKRDPIVDTGRWEMLRAAGLKDAENATGGAVSIIPVQQFDTIDAAIESISELSPGTARQQLEHKLDFTDGTTFIRDFRPTSNHLIISQTQGTMNCDTGFMYRIVEGHLEQIGETAGEPGDLCWTEHMTAFRVDAAAYAAVESIADEPGALSYSLALMPPDPAAISAQAAACTVEVKFSPITYLEKASPATGVSASWVDHLLAKIGPLLRDSLNVKAALQPMIPTPSGDTDFDNFLRAGDDEAHYYLQNLDGGNVLTELPDNKGETSEMTAYALAFEGHRLILMYGRPNYGWRVSSDNSFGVWESTGGKLLPIASGDLAKRASQPEITVH